MMPVGRSVRTALLVLLCFSGDVALIIAVDGDDRPCSVFSSFEIKPEEAQYKIVAPLPLFEADCKTFRAEAVQQMIAIEWALAHWDRNPLHSNYQIGLTVSGTCSKEKELVNQVMKFLSSMDYFDDASCIDSEKQLLRSASGLVLPEIEKNHQKIFKALEAVDLPAVVSSTLTSQFLSAKQLPLTFSTAATIEQYIEACTRFLRFTGSNWVSVLYSNRYMSEATVKAVESQLQGVGVIVETTLPYGVNADGRPSLSDEPLKLQAVRSRIVVLLLSRQELLNFFVVNRANRFPKLFIIVPIREEVLSAADQQTMLPEYSSSAILLLHEPEVNLTDYKVHLADVLHNSVDSHAVLAQYMEVQYNCSLAGDTRGQRSCRQLDMGYLLEHMAVNIPVRPIVLATYTVALLTELVHERPEESVSKQLDALQYNFGEYDPLSFKGSSIKFNKRLQLESIRIEAMFLKRTKSAGVIQQLIMSFSSRADDLHAIYVEPDHLMLPDGHVIQSFCAPHKSECHSCPLLDYADDKLVSITHPGQLFVVGLFDLRTWNPRDLSCNAPRPMKNLLMPLAFSYVLETFKERYPEFGLLPGFELGGIVQDSCSDAEHAVVNVINWNKKCMLIGGNSGSATRIINKHVLAFASGQDHETFSATQQLFYNGSSRNQPFLFSWSPRENQRRNTFSLYPSSRALAKAVVSLLLRYDWSYVSVLLSKNSTESRDAFLAFEHLATLVSICISNVIELDSPEAEADFSGSRVFVSFATATHLASMLQQQKVPSKSVLVLTGTSHDFHAVVDGKDRWPLWMQAAYGALSVQPKLEITREFRSFLANANPVTFRKTWFLRFWEDHFRCRLSNASRSSHQKACTGEETVNLSSFGRMTHERYFMATIESWIFAMDAIYKASCPDMKAPCERFYEVYTEQMRDMFARYRKPESFAVYNLRRSGAKGKYVKIGEWMFEDGLQMTSNALWYYGSETPSTVPFRAQCHPPLCTCKVDRETFKVNSTTVNVYSVMRIPKMSASHLKLKDLPQGWKSFSWTYIFLVTNTMLLLLAVCALGVVLVKLYFRVVKGNQSLGICLLCGVITLYATAYFFIFDASVCVCRIRYFAHSFAYAICFGVLIAKATQLRNGETLGVNGYISHWNYWLLLVFIFAVQIALNLQWIIFTRPVVTHYVGEETQVVTACSWDRDEFLCSQAYVFILLILAMFISFVNRNVKRNYKESRWLLCTCLAVFPVWVLWIVGYMFIPDSLKDALVVVELVICATIILALMFGPKLYILLYYEPVLIEYPIKANHSHGGGGGKDLHNASNYFDYEKLTDGSVSPGSAKTVQSWSAESSGRSVGGTDDVQYKAVVRKKTRSKRVKINKQNGLAGADQQHSG